MPDHINSQVRIRWVLLQNQLIVLPKYDLVGDLVLRDLHGAGGDAQAVLGAVPGRDDPLFVDQSPAALLVDARAPDLDVSRPGELPVAGVQTTHDLPLGVSGHAALLIDRLKVVGSHRRRGQDQIIFVVVVMFADDTAPQE